MKIEGFSERSPSGLVSFAVIRQHDESGVSGTGKVLEGVVFSTGLTVVHWLTPLPRGSLNVFDSFEQFMNIHVAPHPTNETIIYFSDGRVIGPGEWHQNPSPF
jgi:hypothetical protein